MTSLITAHPFRAWLAALILLAMLAAGQACTHLTSPAPTPAGAADGSKTRIGVYDSRAVAVAYAGSEIFDQRMKAKMAERNAAKAAGETQKAAEIDAWAKDLQYQYHLKGFSTAPVDDILAEIKDQLPAIQQKAQVKALVSKWDEEALKNQKNAEKVDVTMLLVDAFKPRPQSREWAQQIQTKKPMPLAQAEKYFLKPENPKPRPYPLAK